MKIQDAKRASLASAAHSLLASKAFQDAMGAVTSDLSEKWKTAGDTEAREAVFYQYDGLRKVVSRLNRLAGEWEAHTIETEGENQNVR